jgi:hypothetical protein
MSLKHKKIINLLYHSFDGILSPKEQSELDNALEHPGTLIEAQRKAVSQSAEGYSFNPFFAQQVMNRINALTGSQSYAEIFVDYLEMLFKRMALVTVTLCLIMISYNILSEEILKIIDLFSPSPVTYEAMLRLPLF